MLSCLPSQGPSGTVVSSSSSLRHPPKRKMDGLEAVEVTFYHDILVFATRHDATFSCVVNPAKHADSVGILTTMMLIRTPSSFSFPY